MSMRREWGVCWRDSNPLGIWRLGRVIVEGIKGWQEKSMVQILKAVCPVCSDV